VGTKVLLVSGGSSFFTDRVKAHEHRLCPLQSSWGGLDRLLEVVKPSTQNGKSVICATEFPGLPWGFCVL
jgi:hypothetical protein